MRTIATLLLILAALLGCARVQSTVAATGVDLTIAGSATPDPVAPGASLTYTITVINDGVYATGRNHMRAPIPTQTTFSTTDYSLGCGLIHGGVYCPVPYLPAGGQATFHFTVVVDPAATGTITATAYADWDKQATESDETNNTVTLTTTVS